ncbi:N-acetylmuramoyl-L-alanine amidase [Bacillus sp. AFS096315]|uniref:N-acetylmuramoyl-L-alanine amidase n=1 Tax=Bacillus sp. AFS096315 TaxID=2033517 RepID=UPI000BEE0568|nr:N-acetylmuramoyl-L-alanine amidase [Bacillus sp. AFS096315]PEC47778.1 N-acetylmuramoyl-L-alanine amidase [Bacillus sp. AFS096315]
MKLVVNKKSIIFFIIFTICILSYLFYPKDHSGIKPHKTSLSQQPKIETVKEKPNKVIQTYEKKKSTKPLVICIDPGHQSKANTALEPLGPGSSEMKIKVAGGTTGIVTKKPEYVLSLEASLKLGEILKKRGYNVIFTRTTNNVNLSNKERAEIANKNNADLFIRIHADGSNDHSTKGFSVLTPSKENPSIPSLYKDSLLISQNIVEEVKKEQSTIVKGISYRDDLSGFNWSKVPVTLIELGFMTNPEEDQKLSDPQYLTNLMMKIADGIDQYSSDVNDDGSNVQVGK